LRCASRPLSAWKASRIPNVDGGGGGVLCNPLRQGGRRFLDNMAWGYDHWAWVHDREAPARPHQKLHLVSPPVQEDEDMP
jgi:hypothetical protein